MVRDAFNKAVVVSSIGAVTTCLLLVPDAQARVAAAADPVTDGVHVMGDSIAHRVHNRSLAPRRRPRAWTVDAYPGRRVTALGTRYVEPVPYPAREPGDYWAGTRHTFHVHPLWGQTIRTAVIALGTNGADHDMSVGEATDLYVRGIRTIRGRPIWKPRKRVVLVTPWRDPSITEGAVNERTGNTYPPYTWSEKGEVYTTAIHRIARIFASICVMRWDRMAAQHPEWFTDGTHPNADGQLAWKRMLYRNIRRCQA